MLTSPILAAQPVVAEASAEMMAVWDDCLLLPRPARAVMRYRRIRVDYRDPAWRPRSWELEGDLAELLQHEIDHLDGVLAVSRAIDGRSFAWRGAPRSPA